MKTHTNDTQPQPQPFNQRALARKHRISRDTLREILRNAQSESEAENIIARYLNTRATQPAAQPCNPDGELSPRQRLILAKAVAQERKNECEALADAREYISRTAHLAQIKALTARLEPLADKARSQLGLSDTQTVALRTLCAQLRNEAADQMERGEVAGA